MIRQQKLSACMDSLLSCYCLSILSEDKSIDFLLIPIYQIRICISRDVILRTCTKIYKNNSESLISDRAFLIPELH